MQEVAVPYVYWFGFQDHSSIQFHSVTVGREQHPKTTTGGTRCDPRKKGLALLGYQPLYKNSYCQHQVWKTPWGVPVGRVDRPAVPEVREVVVPWESWNQLPAHSSIQQHSVAEGREQPSKVFGQRHERAPPRHYLHPYALPRLAFRIGGLPDLVNSVCARSTPFSQSEEPGLSTCGVSICLEATAAPAPKGELFGESK